MGRYPQIRLLHHQPAFVARFLGEGLGGVAAEFAGRGPTVEALDLVGDLPDEVLVSHRRARRRGRSHPSGEAQRHRGPLGHVQGDPVHRQRLAQPVQIHPPEVAQDGTVRVHLEVRDAEVVPAPRVTAAEDVSDDAVDALTLDRSVRRVQVLIRPR